MQDRSSSGACCTRVSVVLAYLIDLGEQKRWFISKRCVNRAAQALRLAACFLHSSKSALGAAAHAPGRLAYTLVTKGEDYTPDRGHD